MAYRNGMAARKARTATTPRVAAATKRAPTKTTKGPPTKTTKGPPTKTTKGPPKKKAPKTKPSAKQTSKTTGLPPRVAEYRAFVLSLPEAKEEIKWGSPHFTVQGKIFSGLSEDEGDYYSGVVVNPDLAASLVDDVLFSVAPYTGRYGGITMNVSKVPPEQARELVQMSYRRSAPARLVKLLESGDEKPTKKK